MLPAKRKVLELQKRMAELNSGMHRLGEEIVKSCKEAFNTDNIQFYTEECYDDNNYYTAAGVQSIDDCEVRTIQDDISGNEELIDYIISDQLSEEQLEEVEENLISFAHLCKRNNLKVEEVLELIDSLNDLPANIIQAHL